MRCEKMDLKKEFKKRRPDLKDDEVKFNEAFKEYAMDQITHLKSEFKEKNPDETEDADGFKEKYKLYKSESPLKKDYDISEAVELWETLKFKEKIEWWRLTAYDLERIVDYIYAADKIPQFYRHMQNDFQKTYLKLKECIKAISDSNEKIPALPPDPDIKEYKVHFGNIYKTEKEEETKKDEDISTSKPEPKPKPDPFRLNLKTSGNLDIKKDLPDASD